MTIIQKIKNNIANIAAVFGTTKTARRKIRDKIRFGGLIKSVDGGIKTEKFPQRINIAFCFDGVGVDLAVVAIRSLLQSSGDACDYNIYCVVDETVSATQRNKVLNVVKNTGSKIIYLKPNNDFDNAYRANWMVAIWYRMMLPKLLSNVDKIIYADIDVIFLQDLVNLWRIKMDKKILAGVRDHKNGYLNSGLLVMNLAQIRKDKLYDKWLRMAHTHKYKHPDQDVLNYSTDGRKIFLPVKYNFQPMMGNELFKVHSDADILDLKHNLVVIHYSNWMKPWHDKNKRPMFSELWWRYKR